MKITQEILTRSHHYIRVKTRYYNSFSQIKNSVETQNMCSSGRSTKQLNYVHV